MRPFEPFPRRVVICLHARDRKAEERPYLVWALAERWRASGMEVTVAREPFVPRPDDALVNHVDLTVTPPAWRAVFARATLAVDGACHDLSKRRVSSLLWKPGDDWDGPLIVKTDANCGGKSEARFASPAARVLGRLRGAAASLRLPRGRDRARWRTKTRIPTESYPVFPSPAALPEGVLENPALVVERFLPERDGDLYAIRTWYGLGRGRISRRVTSTEPIVKSGGVVRREDVPVHADVVAKAKALGLDYGKVDYVVHDGRAYVLDVNRTPTFGPRLDEEKRRWTADRLEGGLGDLWRAAKARLMVGDPLGW